MSTFTWVVNGKKSKQVPTTSLNKYLNEGWRLLDENEHSTLRRVSRR